MLGYNQKAPECLKFGGFEIVKNLPKSIDN